MGRNRIIVEIALQVLHCEVCSRIMRYLVSSSVPCISCRLFPVESEGMEEGRQMKYDAAIAVSPACPH